MLQQRRQKQHSRRELQKNSEEINFEFMLLGTPQQNGIIERFFATSYYQTCAVMAHMRLYEKLNNGLWPECAANATKTENIMVNPNEINVRTRSSMVKFQTTKNPEGILDKWGLYAVSST